MAIAIHHHPYLLMELVEVILLTHPELQIHHLPHHQKFRLLGQIVHHQHFLALVVLLNLRLLMIQRSDYLLHHQIHQVHLEFQYYHQFLHR
jgi:hypothetical protein